MKNRYEDSYIFTSRNRSDFLNELRAVQEESRWLSDVPGKDIRLSSVQPIEVVPFANSYNINEDVLRDTAAFEGTQLIMHIDGKATCLRDTAYSGLLQTAIGVTGPGVGRLWKRSSQLFCETMNEFLKSQSNDIKIYHSCDKVSGVFSSNYKEMEVLDLFNIAETSFLEDMGAPLFVSGHIQHSVVGCVWEFPDAEQKLLSQYQTLLNGKSKLYGASFIPLVSLVTSNTGASMASLSPMFVSTSGHSAAFRVGSGVRVRHDNRQIGGATGCGIEDFADQSKNLFNLFNDGIEAMSKMAEVWVQNPQNTFISACNWAFGERLPRKLASNAMENFLLLSGDEPCTAYDIFMGITDINTEAEKAKYGFDRQVDISECIAKLFQCKNWDEFDVAGQVAWNGVKGSGN